MEKGHHRLMNKRDMVQHTDPLLLTNEVGRWSKYDVALGATMVHTAILSVPIGLESANA